MRPHLEDEVGEVDDKEDDGDAARHLEDVGLLLGIRQNDRRGRACGRIGKVKASRDEPGGVGGKKGSAGAGRPCEWEQPCQWQRL